MREVKREEAHLKINKVDVFCVCVGRERGYVSFGVIHPLSLFTSIPHSLSARQVAVTEEEGWPDVAAGDHHKTNLRLAT